MYSGTEIALLSGAGLLFFGGLWLLINAFRTSIWWGLGILLFSPAALVFLFVHWAAAKGPFKLQLLGLAVVVAAAYVDGRFDVSQPLDIVHEIPSFISKSETIQKCVTLQGDTYYGEVPAGVACSVVTQVKIEPIDKSKAAKDKKQDKKQAGKQSQNFKCDGRQHCSQMTSRAEAEFFLKNCPNTKMDGDGDGIPCENDSRF